MMDTNMNWLLIPIYFIHKTYKQWDDFEKEIKYDNRFFLRANDFEEIKRIQHYSVCEMNQGDINY